MKITNALISLFWLCILLLSGWPAAVAQRAEGTVKVSSLPPRVIQLPFEEA